MSAPTFFPGKDYPDREEWLSRRETPRWLRTLVSRWVYKHPSPFLDTAGDTVTPECKPLMLGINQAKRTADAKYATLFGPRHPAKHGSRKMIVRQRHAYYGRMIDAT